MGSGDWLEKALLELCGKIQGMELDADLISGLVSFCELAPPQDAADYLAVCILSIVRCLPFHLINQIQDFCFFSRLSGIRGFLFIFVFLLVIFVRVLMMCYSNAEFVQFGMFRNIKVPTFYKFNSGSSFITSKFCDVICDT